MGRSHARVINDLLEAGLRQRREILLGVLAEPDFVDDKFVLAEESE